MARPCLRRYAPPAFTRRWWRDHSLQLIVGAESDAEPRQDPLAVALDVGGNYAGGVGFAHQPELLSGGLVQDGNNRCTLVFEARYDGYIVCRHGVHFIPQ